MDPAYGMIASAYLIAILLLMSLVLLCIGRWATFEKAGLSGWLGLIPLSTCTEG